MNRPTELLAIAVTSAALGFLGGTLIDRGCAATAAAPPAARPAPPAGCYLQARTGSSVWYVTRQPRPWQELEELPFERAASDPRWRGVVKVHSRKTSPDVDVPLDARCWRHVSGVLLVGDPEFLDEVTEAVSRD